MGRALSPCDIPTPTSSCSTSASPSTRSATRPSSGCITPAVLWAEGPAWNGVGKLPRLERHPQRRADALARGGRPRQRRSAHPAGNSNGNTFDYEGRQISFEHGNRRVVRYEYNGKVTVLADKFEGKPLNAPNDGVVHPDGGIWFTDPGYGSLMNYEGNKGELGSRSKEAVYRIDAERQDRQADRRHLQAQRPVLLARLQEALRRRHGGLALQGRPEEHQGLGHRRRQEAGQGAGVRLDEADGHAVKVEPDEEMATEKAGFADGIRCDIDGNVWAVGRLGRRRLRRRPHLRPRRHAHRPDPAAGNLLATSASAAPSATASS